MCTKRSRVEYWPLSVSFFLMHVLTAATRFIRKGIGLIIVVSLLVPVLPVSAQAALVPEALSVARGRFLRDAVKAAGIATIKDCVLPYENVPKSLLPFICTAERKGAVAVFSRGKQLDLSSKITRGEALILLMKLLGATPGGTKSHSFTDVDAGLETQAVTFAAQHSFLRPFRSSLFGFDLPLKVTEERTLLKKVKGESTIKVIAPKRETIYINIPAPKASQEDILNSVKDILKTDYLYKDKLNNGDYDSVEDLVKSLNDPHTTYLKPSSSQNFQNQIQGEITGIGAQVEDRSGVLVIVSPLPGSPAEKAGLKPNDEILSVNGVSLAGLSYEDAVENVRGPKGSVAKLHIRRNGTEMDFDVTRDTIRIEDLEISYQGGIAIVELHQFGQLTNDEFRSRMEEVSSKNPTALILDLRSNPGGLLHAASVVVSAFLPKDSVYSTIITSGGETTKETTELDQIFPTSLPVIVLVNKGSASASEIVAGALQDAKRATLVGEKTYGKGTVQEVVEFTDGSSLKLTIAEWKTPLGRKIDGIGLEPDYVVAPHVDRDDQLLKALDLAQ